MRLIETARMKVNPQRIHHLEKPQNDSFLNMSTSQLKSKHYPSNTFTFKSPSDMMPKHVVNLEVLTIWFKGKSLFHPMLEPHLQEDFYLG